MILVDRCLPDANNNCFLFPSKTFYKNRTFLLKIQLKKNNSDWSFKRRALNLRFLYYFSVLRLPLTLQKKIKKN